MIDVWVRNRLMVSRNVGLDGRPAATGGATLVVDAVFSGESADASGCLIDVCLAERLLAEACARFHNDDLRGKPEFAAHALQTNEAVADVIYGLLQAQTELAVRVRVKESDQRWGARSAAGFETSVRARCLVGHAFKGAMFGPAQALHGVTFVVDAVVETPQQQQQPAAAAAAHRALQETCARYNNTNLDDFDEFQGWNTTMETFAAEAWRRVAAAVPDVPGKLTIRVCESDVAELRLTRDLGSGAHPQFRVHVRNRVGLAHSFTGEEFGPAQRLHGVTFVVDAVFAGPAADVHGCLVDVCLADELLAAACAHFADRNLDDDAEFAGVNTTMETVSEAIWARLAAGMAGVPGAAGVTELGVQLRESDVARAGLWKPLDVAAPAAAGPLLVLSPAQLAAEADEEVSAALCGRLCAVLAAPGALAAAVTALRETPRWAAVRWRAVTESLAEIEALGYPTSSPESLRAALGLPAAATVTPTPTTSPTTRDALTFVAPRAVEVRSLPVPELQPTQMLLKGHFSQISAGTELKIFTGSFAEGAQLDETIAGMADEALAYPLEYGYSYVGEVVAVGAALDAGSLVGSLRFAFAAHGSMAVVDAAATQPVPAGVDPRDASFLPAVETALAIAHDAAPAIGARVAVVGQGLIGLLVTAILAQCPLAALDAVDRAEGRRALARAAGATAATAAPAGSDYDVVVEVTGSARALQSAVDAVGYAGKLVIGSWYGDAAAQLALGLRFHRSHMTIVASQVSNIPGAMRDRWSKERRFAEAWRQLRAVRPCALLSPLCFPLAEAEAAYGAAEEARGVCLFSYDV